MLFSRTHRVLAIFALASTFLPMRAPAQTPFQTPDLHKQLDDLYNKGVYQSRGVQLDFQNGGDIYTVLEPAGGNSGEKPAAGRGRRGGGSVDIAAYDTATGKRSILVSASQLIPSGAKEPLAIEEYSWSPDKKKLLIFTNSKRVWRQNTRGDYWIYEASSNKLIKIGGSAPESTLMFATFSPDSSKIAWVRYQDNNLYVQDLATEKITQLTTDGSADIINGTSDWVNEEELALRNCFRWSPDSKSIAYWQFDQSGVGEYTLINDTGEEYPKTFKYKYPQPGTTNSSVRAGVVSIAGGPTTWIKLDGDPRNHYISQMKWAGNSSEVLLEYLDRPQQDVKLILANAATGDTKLFFEETDKAWIDPEHNNLDWITSGSAGEPDLLWVSERDGWRHAYRINRHTGATTLLTHFEADLGSVQAIDNDHGWLYFSASPDDPVRTYLYRSRLDGSGAPERVTPADEPGVHQYRITENGKYALHSFSNHLTPPRWEIVSLPDHKSLHVLQSNEALAQKTAPILATVKTEFVKVPVGNGVVLDGKIILPPNFDPSKKYPVLTNVYGEPAGLVAQDSWASLFHVFIAQQGYIICAFDNQGTPALKGREWRKTVYGAIGVKSSAQQAAAIQQLARDRPYIDTTRMAIWGWSGGGSQTLNVMFRYPDVYSTGIAVAPVPDEAHYDTIYQERYMNLPQDNKQGYHDGSPISYADGLKGHLLIVHGSGDDNVHFQGTELLVNKLIELGKPFDFMDYPNRTHGISEGRGTSFHVYSLISRYLMDHVPAGPR